MVLKGLPDSYQSFTAVITHSDNNQSFSEFKEAFRSYEETEDARSSYKDDSVLNFKLRKAGAGKFKVYVLSVASLGILQENAKRKSKGRWCYHCSMNNHDDKNCRSQKRGERNTTVKAFEEDSDEEDEHTFAFKMDLSK